MRHGCSTVVYPSIWLLFCIVFAARSLSSRTRPSRRPNKLDSSTMCPSRAVAQMSLHAPPPESSCDSLGCTPVAG
ncbi:hypothetical protein DFH27DRAFT_563404 [Peziza echinospora]|nr:hypothetical protein DFH27DRAFT_563404 [Peziza echinospora]